MHDINGKTVHIGDHVVWRGNAGSQYLSKITAVLAEDNVEKEGAEVAVTNVGTQVVSHIRLQKQYATKVRTIKELAKLALEIQDASNLSGIVISFSEVITELRQLMRAEGVNNTDLLNHHPICVLFINKFSSLSGAEDVSRFTYAYNWASEQVK